MNLSYDADENSPGHLYRWKPSAVNRHYEAVSLLSFRRSVLYQGDPIYRSPEVQVYAKRYLAFSRLNVVAST